jgi:hypothetical protein
MLCNCSRTGHFRFAALLRALDFRRGRGNEGWSPAIALILPTEPILAPAGQFNGEILKEIWLRWDKNGRKSARCDGMECKLSILHVASLESRSKNQSPAVRQ